jgi:plasmid maintenance system antidote protein VapI
MQEMKRHGHDVAKLAETIGCKHEVVSNWLSGQSSIDIYFAVQIAKVYDRTVDFLFWRGEVE